MTKIAALLLGLLLPLAAWATSPTLTGNGATSAIATSGVVTFNIGSPAASTLVVLMLACNDVAVTDTLAVVTPSGWTKENEGTAANSTHAVLWKVASGSEGATLNVTVGSFTSECASWYFKFTGYDTTNPIDITLGAWGNFGFSSTYDPPNQTVAGGPLDVYVMASATSRGDEAYVSGSDLTTNAHLNGAGTAGSGRSIAVSYGAYTAISSKNPGAFVIGSAGRDGESITAVIYPPSSGLPKKPLCGALCGPLQGPLL